MYVRLNDVHVKLADGSLYVIHTYNDDRTASMILLIGCSGSAAVVVEETEPSTSTFSNREKQQGSLIHATAPLSVKIPRLDLQCVDMKVRNEHIARSDDRLRCIPRIRPSGKSVAAAGRQSEGLVAIGEVEIARQVEQLMGNEMTDLPALLEQRRPDDRVGGPVSSSMVMNMKPFADPGFWRTRTRPVV
jgi:hypothetical protein